MGNFYKDKERAKVVVRKVLSATTEAFDIRSLCTVVKAQSDLQVGKGIIQDILDVLVYQGFVNNTAGFYSWKRTPRSVETEVDNQLNDLGLEVRDDE